MTVALKKVFNAHASASQLQNGNYKGNHSCPEPLCYSVAELVSIWKSLSGSKVLSF